MNKLGDLLLDNHLEPDRSVRHQIRRNECAAYAAGVGSNFGRNAMARLKRMEAKKVLDEEVARLGVGFAAFEVKDGPRPGSNDLAWWHERTPTTERADTKYNLAHLRAYVRIAGSEVLPAVGIPLDRQRLWMDRSTISRLERDGYLQFTPALHSTFILTDKGRTWMAEGNPDV